MRLLFLLLLPSLLFAASEHPSKWAGCVLWLDGDGNTLDRSFHVNNATLVGNATYTPAGRVFGALAFDGTGDYTTSPTADSINFGTTTPFTLVCWFKTSSAALQTLFEKGDMHVTPSFNLVVRGTSGLRMNLSDGIGCTVCYCTQDTSTNLADGAWHHVAITVLRNAGCLTSSLVVVVDGVSVATTVATTDAETNGPLSSNEALLVGARKVSGVIGDYFAGEVDEVGVFNRPLTVFEVNQLYARGRNP